MTISEIVNTKFSGPVLVLGATGSFAGAVAAELLGRGVIVRALVRNRQKLIARFGEPRNLQIIEGDLQNLDDLMAAAKGCNTIVHGVNYPYDQWFPHMRTATNNVLTAARKNDALIVFPGNVYNLGAASDQPYDETAPHNPVSRKGELRQWMEEELKRYSEKGGRVLIMRAGDYFGPTARNGYVDLIFGGAARRKTMAIFGDLTIAHQWAYVPDLARATVEIMVSDQVLADFEVVNFSGYVAPSQRGFLSDIARVAQAPDKVFRLPWLMVHVMGLFSPLIREVLEMKYLWQSTVLIDGPRMRQILPDFQPTPLDQALAVTIESYRNEKALVAVSSPQVMANAG